MTGVPAPADDVVFNTTASVTMDAAPTVANLTIHGNATLTLNFDTNDTSLTI